MCLIPEELMWLQKKTTGFLSCAYICDPEVELGWHGLVGDGLG